LHHLFWPKVLAALLRDKSLIRELIISKQWAIRMGAMEVLADRWPDEVARAQLTELAVKDMDAGSRGTALQILADKWTDETTRALLIDRAVHDLSDDARASALQMLLETWADEAVNDLLIKRSKVDGFAASRVAQRHSEFGLIVFTRDFDGVGPYLDPTEPLSPSQIEQAAEIVEVPTEKIDVVVHSLSTHLGWDILKGSAA